ncbi:hypothetical protein ACHAPO_010192 [Fusarium lateritium]
MEQGSSKGDPAPTLCALSEKSFATLNQAIAHTTESSVNDLRITLEDERGRLRVWASNLGALQPETSKKSLDYRLRDAPLMRTTVALGLEDLHSSADRALAILNGSLPNRSALLPSDDLNTSNTHTVNELDELIDSIHSAINHLFGISILIRRQKPRGRLIDLDDFTLESSQDITYVTDRFPKTKLNLWLARRLGNNISKQRKIIQYRQEHRESLAKEYIEQSGDTATVIATTYQEGSHSEASQPVSKGSSSSGMSTFTSATSFQSLEDGEGTGRPIPDLSDMALDGVQLQYGEPFECPYCRTIQLVANRYEWKRHVFTDIQPYMCTIRNCKNGNKSFSTRGEWFEHESNVHRWQWDCSWCNSSDSTFPSSEEFKRHLNKSHPGMVTEAQMPLIIDACERPIKAFDSGNCPLCEDWNPTSGSNNAKGFSRHLARHLQQLSLAAIPISIVGLEIRMSDDSSAVGDGSSIGSNDRESILQEEESAVLSDLTQLFLPAAMGREDVVRAFLESGADVNDIDSNGRTALSFAAEYGHEAIVRLLLEKGANHLIGPTPRSFAIENRHEDIVRLLQDHDERTITNHKQGLTGKSFPPINQTVIEKFEGYLDGKAVNRPRPGHGSRGGGYTEPQIGNETNPKLEESKRKVEQAPIQFKDSVGRKFSFPFHLCATWKDMEDLIKQAFMQVDVLGPQVMEGRYDLYAPDGEIILPSVWDKVIQPGWAITMTMWPMDKVPPLGHPHIPKTQG